MITYEEPLAVHEGENKRLTVAVKMGAESPFVEFEVVLNEIPVDVVKRRRNATQYLGETEYQRGKDVVINWEFLDGFNTGNNLWLDANGLFMHKKTLWERKEYHKKRTLNIASNFYPVQSAIAVRDEKLDRQIVIMPDRVQSGSAGLRGGRNIELIQNRRVNGWDGYGVFEFLNDLDDKNKSM